MDLSLFITLPFQLTTTIIANEGKRAKRNERIGDGLVTPRGRTRPCKVRLGQASVSSKWLTI